jgi:hypothetical protein
LGQWPNSDRRLVGVGIAKGVSEFQDLSYKLYYRPCVEMEMLKQANRLVPSSL